MRAALASCATLVALAPSVAIADGGPPSRSATSLRAVLEAVIRAATNFAELDAIDLEGLWTASLSE
jgi:hypothetical protein